ncbi:DoxX family protein [Sorangium cellulosum]|uniref:DoxX family protein n=2 Tax=Sorangium cellulosum TaxID=56 RepID=A0A150PAY4_SORCE|nr:DoxX family protein [Sorangium cellulosum]AGP36917.1 DoxX family protein [Sorangium cellulosum So0157-2]KYF52751.1 DoxX family protein [Sorangium cellulosum]
MAPLLVLSISFALLLLLGRLGVRHLASWVTCLRYALAAMFLLTASAHWGSRRAELVAMVPPALPSPELLVTITGVLEIAGAAALLMPRLAPWAAAGLTILLVAMFPANVHAARAGLTLGGSPVTPLVPRTLIQIVFLAATVAVAIGGRGSKRM